MVIQSDRRGRRNADGGCCSVRGGAVCGFALPLRGSSGSATSPSPHQILAIDPLSGSTDELFLSDRLIRSEIRIGRGCLLYAVGPASLRSSDTPLPVASPFGHVAGDVGSPFARRGLVHDAGSGVLAPSAPVGGILRPPGRRGDEWGGELASPHPVPQLLSSSALTFSSSRWCEIDSSPATPLGSFSRPRSVAGVGAGF